ncbi:hypothetical protein FIU87_13140 [Bacillus sp. THAF10]|uniref:hypothetical protein n=1 Tax=Bacillus sp. THAF10 TaxID=2587848 RepID=UPI001269508C|nr:hypothetical protein [Bacillus sp. THAF10]QFT89599.1 hypothetical protein FIU87_13140 [Bacillus sp. THAF10]
MKRFLFYFLSTIVIGFIFFLGYEYLGTVSEEAKRTYNMTPLVILSTIFPILMGMLLRLPKLIMEIKENKQWTFDWIKLTAIGIPALYIAVIPLVYITFEINMWLASEIMFTSNTTLITMAGVVFGYLLLDSLKK